MREIKVSKEWTSFMIILAFQIMINYLVNGYVSPQVLIHMTFTNTVLIYTISFVAYTVVTGLRANTFYRDMAFCVLGTAIYISLFLGEKEVLRNTADSFNLQMQLICLIGLFESCFLLRGIRTINKPSSSRRIICYHVVAVLSSILFIYMIGIKIRFAQMIPLYTYLNLVILLIYMGVFLNCKKVKAKFSERGYINFRRYIMCKLAIQGIMIISSIEFNMIDSILVSVLRVMGSYYIFKLFLGDFINMSTSVYYDSKELENRELTRIVQELNDTKKELQGSLKEYKELVTFLPEGIIIVQNDVISFANDKMAHLFNLISPSSLEGKNIFNIIHPIDHGKFAEILNHHKKNEMVLIHFNLLNNDFAGEVKLVNVDDEDQKSYTIIIKDLTEQIKILKMEHMLLEKKEEEKIKNEILTNISHEFKTPVNVIYAAAQLQEQNILSKDWEGVRKYTPVMRQNCNRLIRLINNFIDITRLDHNELHIKKVYANIVPIIEDVTLSIVSFAENKGISVLFDTEDEEIYCYIDIDLVERVMLNLLSNAIKYNKHQGSITVTLTDKEDQVGISIKDTGVGMDEGHVEILFNRFERGDKTLTRDNEGSGLGLNIAKNMVECLGGNIEVNSIIDEGTTMTVYLPKATREDGFAYEEDEYHYDTTRLKKSVEMELSDIYE